MKRISPLWFVLLQVILSTNVEAIFIIEFDNSLVATTPVFSDVEEFQFEIFVNQPIRNQVYSNPFLRSYGNAVVYSVSGDLAPGTPSGFSSFFLERNIAADDFYDQGSSLTFEIAPGANVFDGVQVSDLTSKGFVFNGREVDTGRYHPALLEINPNGTGTIRNSNNMGGVNPGSGNVVNVDFGEEYITKFTFDPAELTLIEFTGGDFNGDGLWDCSDIDDLSEGIAIGSANPNFDLNGDGAVDLNDITDEDAGWLAIAGGNSDVTGGAPFLVGDITLDGVVDGLDFIEWNDNKFTSSSAWCQGDLNADGFVEGLDFIAWNDNKFTSSSDTASVPEPALGCVAVFLFALLLQLRIIRTART